MENILPLSIIILWIVVLFNLVISFALIRRMNNAMAYDPTPDMLKPGEIIPDFRARTLTREVVGLGDYTQPELVLVFVSYGCPHCTEVMPELNELYFRLKPLGIEIITVSISDLEWTEKYVWELDFKAPIISAHRLESSMFENYHANLTPSFYYVNEERRILNRGLLGTEWNRLVSKWNQRARMTELSSINGRR